MSTASTTHTGTHTSLAERANAFRIKSGTAWASAMKVSGALAVLGLALAAFGGFNNPHRFAYSYLFAFFVALTIGLGALFFIFTQHLTISGWSVTVRRTAEFYATGLLLIPVLFIPIALSATTLYPWLSTGHGGGHGQEHGAEHAPAAHAEGANATDSLRMGEDNMLPPDASLWEGNDEALHEAHAKVLAAKEWYLNPIGAGIRALMYFAIWALLAWRFFSLSVAQDTTGGIENTKKLQKFSFPAVALFGLSLTFAAFDWIMSLEPTWYSTIFGVYVFAGCAVTIFALIIVTTLSFKNAGFLGNTVTTEHYHDLGKMMFGFIVFWAYIGFSQFMLIWYASIPEETTFFHLRWEAAGWRGVSLLLVAAHFAFPFLFVISRNVKRRLTMLGFAAGWMLVMHVVDIYWLVMPYADNGAFRIDWLDFACLIGVVSAYLTVVFYFMNKHSLVAVGDPRIGRAMRFHNA